ncbi:MAG TPA: HEAT repeat domain-containing protein [Kofleriaceae bacterium]|nr:HEAT repeat domain-containing protein [Kofleriaceae bacterium]
MSKDQQSAMASPVSAFLCLALATPLLAQCHRTGDERPVGVAMSEANDLDTDDVGAVRQHYSTIDHAGADTMAMLERALESDARVRVRANAVTALDALPIMDLFGKGVFDQNRRDIRRYLIRALDDDAAAVKTRAAATLAVHDMDEEAARTALHNHEAQLRAAVANQDERVANDALQALTAMKVPLPLEALLRATSERLRETGIDQAGFEPAPAAVPLLVQIASGDPVPRLRQRALQVLAERYHGPEATKLFDHLLDDTDDEISAAAAAAIARAGDSSLAPHLRQVIAPPVGNVRAVGAIRALAKLADTASVSAIAARLNDAQPVGGEASLALNILIKAGRSYVEWQAWAKRQGYLR